VDLALLDGIFALVTFEIAALYPEEMNGKTKEKKA
jgi:hypothetical protein